MGYKPKPSISWINETTIGLVPPTGGTLYLYLGDREFEITSTLEASLGRSGIGGLSGGTSTANTAYYVYAVLQDGFPALTISPSPPSRGLGFGTWTYLGAVATREASAVICEFQSINGVTSFDDDIETKSHTGDLLWTAYVFESLPVTAKVAFCKIRSNGAGGVEDLVGANGTGTTNNYPLVQRSQVLNVDVYSFGTIPITTPQTIYLVTTDIAQTVTVLITGWMEDPELYP